MQQPKQKRNLFAYIGGALMFLVVLAVMVVATLRLSAGSEQQGVEATHDAIRRSAVLCYATEGYYPPDLPYIEEHYGVQIDHSRYVVRYDVVGSNMMPEIYVFQL